MFELLDCLLPTPMINLLALFEGEILGFSRRLATLAVLLLTGCSAVGFELENYGFCGSIPTPDGNSMQPGVVRERVRLPVDGDTTDLRDGELQLDTVIVGGDPMWLVVRNYSGNGGEFVRLDSIWLVRTNLRTVAVSSRIGDEVIRQRFDRRSVETEKVSADGKVSRKRMLHPAAPYSLAGIEVVLGAMPLRNGTGGSIPLVDHDGREMRWMQFKVISSTLEPKSVAGGTVFRPIWIVQTSYEGRTGRLWIDSQDRAAVRREEFDSDGTKLLVVRGQGVPRVRMFPVEPLAAPGEGIRAVFSRPGSGSQ